MVSVNRSFRSTLFAAAALAAVSAIGAGSANATVFSGSATLTCYACNGSGLTFTTQATPFTTTDGAYTPGILSLTTADAKTGSVSDHMYLTLAWTQPSSGVLQFSQFNGQVDETINGTAATGDVNWGVPSHTEGYNSYVEQDVKFADGTTAVVELYNATLTGAGTSLTGQIGLRVTDVPEPMSLALFGVGMTGLGVVARRRQARRPQATA